ncbi:hypothetical protein TELCIR_10194 [Teladorsagia circumcincta]|uniref:Methyltransferase FkbM domain-containing protein n=1 Tax=Teladorsagia circumcincta TaxID=45464 RepID=A0A2G9UCY7_TELCI|nr:hypothetical protein TELCIR_10194 [Teladorsagia circumcincta]
MMSLKSCTENSVSVHVVTSSHDDEQPKENSILASCKPYACYLLAIVYTIISSQTNRGDPSNMFAKNNRCLQSRTDGMHVEELWSKIPMIINQCSERRYLRIRGYSNRDEIKVHVMPSEDAFSNGESCAIVSLGVGRDVQAEVSMKEDLPNCSFFGADPVKEPNQDMFEAVGVFYHIAVGGRNGTSMATVLEPDTRSYRIREVNHVDIATFLGRFIRKQYIDQLIIDIEWEEYDVLPYLVKSGDLENSDVVLCQINVEIHNPDYEQKVLFFEFFLELLDDRRYIPIVADTMLGHIRLYLLNYEHPECRRRYVAP